MNRALVKKPLPKKHYDKKTIIKHCAGKHRVTLACKNNCYHKSAYSYYEV